MSLQLKSTNWMILLARDITEIGSITEPWRQENRGDENVNLWP